MKTQNSNPNKKKTYNTLYQLFSKLIYAQRKECDKKMNDSIYEEYMRNILGYQPMSDNTYDMNFESFQMPNISAMNSIQIQELENCYPDIYRIVYPMVQKICSQNTKSITRELIDKMTDEIYFSIEDKEMLENRNKQEISTNDTENRQIVRDTSLNDLIRILILRELLGRPNLPGDRLPPPRPPRPQIRPFIESTQRPIMFNRQAFTQYNDLYEY